MTKLSDHLTAIRSRLEQCHDKEPEKWNSDMRCYYYPKWDEFAAAAPTDIAKLLRAVELLREQRDKYMRDSSWSFKEAQANCDAELAKLFEEGE